VYGAVQVRRLFQFLPADAPEQRFIGGNNVVGGVCNGFGGFFATVTTDNGPHQAQEGQQEGVFSFLKKMVHDRAQDLVDFLDLQDFLCS
jgi:hypothetical protein